MTNAFFSVGEGRQSSLGNPLLICVSLLIRLVVAPSSQKQKTYIGKSLAIFSGCLAENVRKILFGALAIVGAMSVCGCCVDGGVQKREAVARKLQH